MGYRSTYIIMGSKTCATIIFFIYKLDLRGQVEKACRVTDKLSVFVLNLNDFEDIYAYIYISMYIYIYMYMYIYLYIYRYIDIKEEKKNA